MSKDIRSFFTTIGSVKKKETKDVETKQDNKAKPQKKKRVAIISDSDDEDVPAPVKKQKSTKPNVSETCSKYFKEAKKPVAEKAPVELKPVKAIDIFGSDKVKRSATKTLKEQVVEEPAAKRAKDKRVPLVTLDDDRNSDLEFEATLSQLDEIEAKAVEEFARERARDVSTNGTEKRNENKGPEACKRKGGGRDKARHGVEYVSDSDEDDDSRWKRGKESEEKNKTMKKKVETKDDEDKSSRGKTKKESENKAKSSKSKRELEDEEDKSSRGKTNKESEEKAKPSKKRDLEDEEDKSSKVKTKKESEEKAKPSKRSKRESEDEEDKPSRVKTKKESEDKAKSSKRSKRELEDEQDKPSKVKAKKEADKPSKKTKSEDEEDKPLWATDPAERRRVSAIGYQRYLQRGGPKHLGAKEIPQGTPNCLAGLTFVITGVLDSIERDDAAQLVVSCGGRVVGGVSKTTSYLVVGEDAGPAKLAKAEKLGTRIIGEDELFDLVRGGKGGKKSEPEKKTESEKKPDSKKSGKESKKTERVTEKKAESKATESPPKPTSQRNLPSPKATPPSLQATPPKPSSQSSGSSQPGSQQSQSLPPSQLWVDKYRPTSIKNIIGQQGDKSNVKKLSNWLQNWHRNQFGGKKLAKPSPWARDDDGAFFKAALLSGPPGVGKTTSAHLVSKELGFDIVEFNASDTRSKRLLREEVSELLSTKSLNDYFRSDQGKTSSKHVLLMDEVDGMAGNEDRGGMQELIQLIKNAKVPVLCMCNDVHHQKIRSLLGHCFDLRFQKPRVEQIRGAMQSVCFKEKLKIPPELLTEMITGSNQDVRQVLHHLSLYSAKVTETNAVVSKHVKLGPWDVMKKVFSADQHRTMSLNDKSDLFFHDYNISPLFVQENYLSVLPDAARNDVYKRLDLIAQAADSICMGDTVERCIRSKNAWTLLPIQAMYASVIPGDLLEGHMTAQINFPSWLGKNSRRGKFDRLLQEVHSHTRLSVSCDKQGLNLDYLPRLREAIARPLIRSGADGIPEAISVMQAYHLLRSDIDSIAELSVWPGEQDPMTKVESKVKAALTRTYNKDLVLPYSTAMTVSKKRPVALSADNEDLEEEEEDDDEADEVSADAMIKAKKRPAKKEPTAGPSAAKRGRGKK